MRTKPSTINRSVRAQENLADASPLGCGAAFMHADRQHRKLLLAQPSSAPSASASEDKKNAVAAKARGETRRSNRGALPAHLPRLDVTIEPEDSNCPCCRSPMACDRGGDLRAARHDRPSSPPSRQQQIRNRLPKRVAKEVRCKLLVPVHHRLRLLAFPMRTADANN
jgi:hypothetical protein